MNMCETTSFSALNLVPFNFSVHYPADEPARAEWDESLQEYHAFHSNSILALEDGAYLRIQTPDAIVLRGNCWLLAKGQERQKSQDDQMSVHLASLQPASRGHLSMRIRFDT